MHSFFVTPIGPGTGLTSVSLGLVRAFDQQGVRVGFYKPVAQTPSDVKSSSRLVIDTVGIEPVTPITLKHAEHLLSQGLSDTLLEELLTTFRAAYHALDVVIIEGLVPDSNHPFVEEINTLIAHTLNCDVILVAAKNHFSETELNERILATANRFGGTKNPKVLGCILNKLGAPDLEHIAHSKEAAKQSPTISFTANNLTQQLPVFTTPGFSCLGAVAWNPLFVAPRVDDVVRYLNANVLSSAAELDRRVLSLVVTARTVPNMLQSLKVGALIITPGDREDILLAASMAVLNGVPIAGLVLTGGLIPDPRVMQLCAGAMDTGLPILSLQDDTFGTAKQLAEMSTEVPSDDANRMSQVMDAVAHALDLPWLLTRAKQVDEPRLSPPAFRHQLGNLAKLANKKIVLPEGEEPRTIQAACIAAQKQMAKCILLGCPNVISKVAATLGLTLPPGVEIIDPNTVRQNYVAPMVELRKAKGMTSELAHAALDDAVYVGTMMLALGEVDGLVSGTIHTTANTIRPALQLIKSKASARLVSSVFFMLLPEHVLVYGDCAVNPNPNAEQLADIAIQSGITAKVFGIEPRIAMISYSTGSSGTGADVDKVREATRLAKAQRPDLLIDGPLQYDAAAIASVAANKAPQSPIAGNANVFIFPDLNTGNTTYKAVQRSAHVLSVGPVLQGLNKPVNDLSRGALVEDIVYTIAITAVQADQSCD